MFDLVSSYKIGCTLRLTFYLPSAANFEHFRKLLIFNIFRNTPKSAVFVLSEPFLAGDGQTLDSFFGMEYGSPKSALEAIILFRDAIGRDKLIYNAIAEGAKALVGGNKSLHGVSV